MINGPIKTIAHNLSRCPSCSGNAGMHAVQNFYRRTMTQSMPCLSPSIRLEECTGAKVVVPMLCYNGLLPRQSNERKGLLESVGRSGTDKVATLTSRPRTDPALERFNRENSPPCRPRLTSADRVSELDAWKPNSLIANRNRAPHGQV